MAYLLANKNDLLKDSTFPLPTDTTIIGRHPCCEIVLDHGAVSREHARIIHESQGYFLEDLHSRNGTMLNGRTINSRVRIYNGDIIRICDVELTFTSDLTRDRTPEVGQYHSAANKIIIVDDDDRKSEKEPKNITSIALDNPKAPINSANAEAKLHALIEIGRNLGADLDQVLPQLLENLLKIFRQADCAYILLNDPQTKRLELKAFRHRNPQNQDSFRISRSTLELVAQSKSAILSDDVGNDSRFDPSESIVNYHICSIMAAPILDSEREECLGVIQVDSRAATKKFNYNDLDLLVSVAYQIAVAIQNAQLHEIAIQEKIIDRELNVAHKVQKGLLPVANPDIAGYEFFDYYQPAKYLGGDYYDYIPFPNGEIAIALGDVSGKGISAALLMAKLSAEARYGLLMEPTLTGAMGRLNHVFCENRWENRFITFMLAVLNPDTHSVRFVNAGHFPPILVDSKEPVKLIAEEYGGFPLGIVDGTEYKEFEYVLQEGQSIVFLSDGLTDAMNAEGEFFSLQGVIDTLNGSQKLPVPQQGRNLVSAVRSFAGRTQQTDDQCLVIFGRKNE